MLIILPFPEPSPSRQERFNRMKSELTHRGKEKQVEEILEKLADALEDASEKLDEAEKALRANTPIGPGVEQRSAGYVSFYPFSSPVITFVNVKFLWFSGEYNYVFALTRIYEFEIF